MPETETTVVFPSEKSAFAAAEAVRAELGASHEKRSETAIKSNKNVVSLKITAEDDSALRASLGSYTRLLNLCRKLSHLDGGNENDGT